MLTDTPLSVADVLERAADLIEPEGAWIKNGNYALNLERSSVDALDLSATCFCAMGAVHRVAGVSTFSKSGPVELVNTARNALYKILGEPMASWNDRDGRTQPEVVAALRRAATLARAGDA